MRWNNDTEAYVRKQLEASTCPLCGGRIRQQRRRVMSEGRNGCWADYVEDVCLACGVVVEEGGFDGDF